MNKFKVGDRVRLVKVENEDFQEYKNCLGKIFKIVQILHPESSYASAKLEGTSIIPYLKNLELVKDEYTYEDLKKCPVGTKITFENGRTFVRASESDYRTFTDTDGYRGIEDLKGLKDSWLDGYYGEIVKIEEPTYETVYEYKPEILDEAEKRYLKDVIRPFRNRIKYICKSVSAFGKYEYIEVNLGNDTLVLPDFKPNTMYKGMKVDKKYALKELDL